MRCFSAAIDLAPLKRLSDVVPPQDDFSLRQIGPRPKDVQIMLKTVGLEVRFIIIVVIIKTGRVKFNYVLYVVIGRHDFKSSTPGN